MGASLTLRGVMQNSVRGVCTEKGMGEGACKRVYEKRGANTYNERKTSQGDRENQGNQGNQEGMTVRQNTRGVVRETNPRGMNRGPTRRITFNKKKENR